MHAHFAEVMTKAPSGALSRSLSGGFSFCSFFRQTSVALEPVLSCKNWHGDREISVDRFSRLMLGFSGHMIWSAIRAASCSYLSLWAPIRSLACTTGKNPAASEATIPRFGHTDFKGAGAAECELILRQKRCKIAEVNPGIDSQRRHGLAVL
jgi:hypothetical protein